MKLCRSSRGHNKVILSQSKSTNFLLKLRRNCELLASLQELWMESFRILIICFIVSKAFSMWKLSGCPASVYFESCCENDKKKTWKLSFQLQLIISLMTIKLICDNRLMEFEARLFFKLLQSWGHLWTVCLVPAKVITFYPSKKNLFHSRIWLQLSLTFVKIFARPGSRYWRWYFLTPQMPDNL